MTEIKKIEFKIWRMSCINCENKIKEAILRINGVSNIKVSYFTEKTAVEFDPIKTDIEKIMNTIRDIGYEPREMY